MKKNEYTMKKAKTFILFCTYLVQEVMDRRLLYLGNSTTLLK